MKKVIVLVIAMLISSLHAQIAILIPQLSPPNGEVLVPINVSNFNNVGSFTLRVQYNPSILTFVEATSWHSQVPQALAGASNGVVSMVWSSITPANISSGKLVDLKFTFVGGYSGLTFVTNQCEVTDAVGNPLSVNYVSGSVPVELLHFESIYLNNSVQLKWATTTETNNKGFVVERMVPNETWNEIGFIPGAGSTTEKQTYSFIDNQITSVGAHNYRLIQVDFNGMRSTISESVVEISSIVESYELWQNFPNPFNPETIIKYSIPRNDFVSLKVFTQEGIEVATLVSEEKKAGVYSVNFKPNNLPSGVYFYRMTSGKSMIVKKLLLLK